MPWRVIDTSSDTTKRGNCRKMRPLGKRPVGCRFGIFKITVSPRVRWVARNVFSENRGQLIVCRTGFETEKRACIGESSTVKRTPRGQKRSFVFAVSSARNRAEAVRKESDERLLLRIISTRREKRATFVRKTMSTYAPRGVMRTRRRARFLAPIRAAPPLVISPRPRRGPP
jgi:hypothetical protein